MADYDLVIRGGTVVTAAETTTCDVGIANGKIVALGSSLSPSAREIDASGRLVLPGGVDSHCQIHQPPVANGSVNADTFETATRSAAAGGTTTVISFSSQSKGSTLTENLRAYHEKARNSFIDYSFHLIVTDPSDAVLKELPPLIAEGHRSLKVFMTYGGSVLNDAEVLRVLAMARKHGALITVHAENHEAIMFLTQALLESGLSEMKYHAWAKPMVVEREATHRVIALAELLDQPIQVFHVSGAESAEEIHRAQQRGLKVLAETCTQYLVLTAADLDRPGFEGAKFLCSPAPRTRDDQEALWGYIRTGALGVVSSDHSPFSFDDPKGKKLRGDAAPFSVVPNGVPGLATRLPILFSEGVIKGRIDLQTFVSVTATNPARLFGISPQKGSFATTAADIAIWDPEKRVTITNDILHHAVDYTIYEGMQVQGWPITTLSRGEVVCEDGEIKGRPGHGRFLAREPYAFIKPRGRFVTPFNPVDRTIEAD
ncbi:MAG: dihydropyrimidinase [Variibacter sp.]